MVNIVRGASTKGKAKKKNSERISKFKKGRQDYEQVQNKLTIYDAPDSDNVMYKIQIT